LTTISKPGHAIDYQTWIYLNIFNRGKFKKKLKNMKHLTEQLYKISEWYKRKKKQHITPNELPKLPIFLFRKTY